MLLDVTHRLGRPTAGRYRGRRRPRCPHRLV